jgi:hypothetical protein
MNLLVNHIRRQKLFQGAARKIQRGLVAIEAASIHREHGYVLRNGVHELTKLPLRVFAFCHIANNGEASDNVSPVVQPGPFQEFYTALVAKGMRPEMARLTLARKIARIVLIV